ncbi:hypothetical protein DUNSADRAFT_3132 [Dunaliella salina]|uniref:Uncharacterized protein n=1 Tax=Dunaliella salina TaxID=3046 RepID=A0ABQ7H851_DUNSA|nr:hypothetical protein DUNSADRAFT_3132 [Dunaliella salina]|eukprot:KAF5843003.1 hypothetical protein DUNSADRAFT_3132 [Dunaliella salina]
MLRGEWHWRTIYLYTQNVVVLGHKETPAGGGMVNNGPTQGYLGGFDTYTGGFDTYQGRVWHQPREGSTPTLIEQSPMVNVGTQRAELQKRKEALAVRMAQLDMAVAAEEPALRHQLSLFAHISKVMWKLDQEDRIAGTVSDPKRGDIIRIDLDPSAMTHFEAVNKLWGIIA